MNTARAGGDHSKVEFYPEYRQMKITLRKFQTDDLIRYEKWRNAINAQQYMSNFFPHVFNGEIVTCSNRYLWYVILADNTEVGTIWLEKEKLQDSMVNLGIVIGHPDKLGIGIGQRAIALAIELARKKLGIDCVRLFVRKNNVRAIACYEACGFETVNEGSKINQKGNNIAFWEMQMQGSII